MALKLMPLAASVANITAMRLRVAQSLALKAWQLSGTPPVTRSQKCTFFYLHLPTTFFISSNP
jgi:hypothetical protein